MATKKKSKPAAKKGRAGLRPWSEPTQTHLDIAGLALIAAAAYLAYVLYAGGDPGHVGGLLVSALEWLFGASSALAPIGMALTGIAMMARPKIPNPGALSAGAILLLAGWLLAWAAGTAGAGPAKPLRVDYFEPEFFKLHGGVLGESLYWAVTTLFQRAGAHIAAVLLIAVGLLVASGTTIAAIGASAARGAGRVRDGAGDALETARQARPIRALQTPGYTEPGADDPGAFETAVIDAEIFAEAETGELEPAEAVVPESDEGPGLYEDPEDDSVPGPNGPERIEISRTPMGEARGVTTSDEIEYQLPDGPVLKRGPAETGPDKRDHEPVARALLEALGHFGIEAKIVGIVSGPHVSRFELQLSPGTKVSKISQLKDDLAYALASTDIRILAPIPGKRAVGVEIPNQRRRIVRLGDICAQRPKGSSPLVAWLGRDVSGQSASADIATMPHLLVAGTTGSGKSGCVNAMLCSILMHASPNEVRLVLVDPKRVELNHYEALPHLLTPVVTNPRLAANVLANLIGEMESRYMLMSEYRSRNLIELNRARAKAGEPTLPYILCVIDELADLMMVAPAEVEDSIIRLAQKSRAVGIHLVLATQRPSTDIITGTIKVNIPARIAFAVSSQVDSRVILDGGGAESLLGQGDMLVRGAGTSKLTRVQGAFVTEDEIAKLVRHWTRQGEPDFAEELLSTPVEEAGEVDHGEFSPDEDDLLEEAVRLVVSTETASVSMIQRRLRVGYTRAGRLIDMLERRGVISGYEGSKPRQVLISEAEIARVLGSTAPEDEGSNTQTELEPLIP